MTFVIRPTTKNPFSARKAPHQRRCRRGKAVFFLLVGLPALFGMMGLVFDVGTMYADRQNLRHASDAAATAAAMDLVLGKSTGQASATVDDYLIDRNGNANAHAVTNIPPTGGVYAGRSGFVEVIADHPYQTKIMHLVGAAAQTQVRSRSVAGPLASTTGAAIVVLDPQPPPVSVGIALPLALNYPALLGGLEVLGAGAVRVDGSVLVNTRWGGVDENGSPAGVGPGPPYGISCTPLLQLTKLQARDIRVVGGVDNQANYSDFVSGQPSPLKASRTAVPDPYAALPVPSESASSAGVDTTLRGGVRVATLPLIGPTTTLQPGVYEYIEIISGTVVFQPGVYVIRSVSPLTGISLSIVGTTVTANGVLFYITNSQAFSATDGSPDNADVGTTPTAPTTPPAVPSVVINAALLNSSFTPLQDPLSPLNGLLLYQRRNDFRPIAIVNQTLIGGAAIRGTIYAKWGHVIFAADGTYDVRIVAGSLRLAAVLSLAFTPSQLLPPAQDVYLVE